MLRRIDENEQLQHNAADKTKSKWRRRTISAMLAKAPDDLIISALNKWRTLRVDLHAMKQRSKEIKRKKLCIGQSSEQQRLRDYRFHKRNIARISNMVKWPGITSRNQYSCNTITATCTFSSDKRQQ